MESIHSQPLVLDKNLRHSANATPSRAVPQIINTKTVFIIFGRTNPLPQKLDPIMTWKLDSNEVILDDQSLRHPSARSAARAHERERERDRDRDRDRDRETETDRQTDRQTDKQTETDRDRQRQTETDRDRPRQTETEIESDTERQTDR